MVTAYYIIKMSKNKRTQTHNDNFNGVFSKIKSDKTCRVCLRKGDIPIFCDNNDISEGLATFAGIEVSENDYLPKHLCQTCNSFIKEATAFRNTAKQSEERLKQSTTKKDTGDVSDSNYADADGDNFSQSDEEQPSAEKSNKIVSKPVPSPRVKKKEKPKTTCKICNKVMNTSYFKEHMSVHDPNHSKYICEICGKSFKLRCSYFNHKGRHRSDFPYKCQFCPYRGKYRELFKSHMRTHTGDYQYMCTECPARFLYKSNLNSHIKKHKEPEFKCDSCKRAFHTKLMLQRHYEADHLGIKNHVCSLCGKAFGYRNAMMKHQRHMHKREKCQFRRVPAYFLEDQRKEQDTFL